MPGYGVLGEGEGTGLLPWSWAESRLASSRDYWIATVWPDGRPHLMPVWAVWHEGALWFSSGERSRKARNLRADPRCSISTDSGSEPVVIEGRAEPVAGRGLIRVIADLEEAKYATRYAEQNSCFRVAPVWAYGSAGDDPTGSPTRWAFE